MSAPGRGWLHGKNIPLLDFRVLARPCQRGVAAQEAPDWTNPFPPYRIIGNIYYVGSQGLAVYLITTPQGNILINSNLEKSVPMIRDSVEKLGFRFSDTKILLISHAHWDHCAGSAAVKELTGAKYMVMDADVPAIEDGRKRSISGRGFKFSDSGASHYQPTKVDRVLHDGDQVKLGDTVLTAHLTPGHTKGTTTWTMKVSDGGKTYDVVIVGSPNVNPGIQIGEQCALSADCVRLRADVSRPEILAVRCVPRRARRLLRHGGEVRANESGRRRIRSSIPRVTRVTLLSASKRSVRSLQSKRPQPNRCRIPTQLLAGCDF